MEFELKDIEKTVSEVSQKEGEKLKSEISKDIEKLKGEFSEAQKNNASADELKKLSDKLGEMFTKFDEFELASKAQRGEVKSFEDQLEASLEKSKDTFAKMKSDKSTQNVLFDIDLKEAQKSNYAMKAAGTMTTGNYSGGTVGLTTWDNTFTRIVRRQPFLRQLVTVRPVSSKYIAWAEQASADGGAGNTAEGAAKTQADFDIVERNKLVEKITAYIKVSKEALDDISFLQSEINTELVELLSLKLDTDLLSGSGTSPVIKGILPYATSYTGGSFVDLVESANQFDVIRCVVADLQNASYMANYVLLNPIDAALMDLVKVSTTDGRYVLPPFVTANGQTISGLQVVVNPGVTAGDFVIGDFSKSNLGMREEINIQIGYENDDFTKNLVTILGELRAVHYIKTNHAGAFYKGTFATVQANIEKPAA